MKKMLAILLLVSAVVGMTIPAMATEAESHSDAANTANTDITLDASNYAAHTVAVTLDAATQSNNIGENLAVSGGNANSADATFKADAKAKEAASGDAASGGVGSGSASAGDDDATSGDATSGDAASGGASNTAQVQGNGNVADASGNDMTTGNVDNVVVQVNKIVQIVPVEINNDQAITQDVSVHNHLDAISNPVTAATETNTDYNADLQLDGIDDSGLGDIEVNF